LDFNEWYNFRKPGKNNNGTTKKKKRAEPMEVWIVAEPHAHSTNSYERTYYSKKLNAGSPIPLTVSLKPKNKNTN
jgi:hypothetical protein